MLRSDGQIRIIKVDSLLDNINSITVDVIAQIENELDPYDLVSLVFLLYDVPDTALQRLIVYQRVSQDIGEKSMNLLYDWAQHVQGRPVWKYEFLEALAICQLYRVIRKLGFNVQSVQKHYLPDNINATIYINPMKKALYKLCENISSETLKKLQNTLQTYDIDTKEYKNCELVFLELMCKKFIIINYLNVEKAGAGNFQIDKLAKIIQNFPELQKFATELREIQSRHNNEPKVSQPTVSSTSKDDTKYESVLEDQDDDRVTVDDFHDLFEHISKLNIDDSHFQSDNKKSAGGAYEIKNAKRVGVCYIINQEDFHPSKESIESNVKPQSLEKRLGSNKDKIVLEKTMSSLNFEVISHCNIDHRKMLDCIKNIIEYRVQPDDSMFMLCILSHGVRGHVYAADSVKVKIDDIQSLLDEGLQKRQLEIPKIMILQACQVNDDEPSIKLQADGPPNYYLKKLNFLIFRATAPELEAYRDIIKGSLFIQFLCHVIKKCAKNEHLYDIFTKVTDGVAELCTGLKRDQVPIFESTLRKKLFLQIPE